MTKKKASRGGTAMIRYVSKRELPSVRGNKRRVIDEVLAAEIKKHGDIDVNRLVAKISDEGHPLHSELIWDDALCGQRFRFLQVYAWVTASRYAGYVTDHRRRVPKEAIAHEVTRHKLRQYLPTYTGGAFLERQEALATDATRSQFVERKLESLRAWARSVVDIDELAKFRDAIIELVGE